ncbi:cache domain-containing protein [Sulfurimonas sp.]|uniref:cache domain-containing protein n=1 Tax=Sulfurimonas sp. TaxID=2022749 RepID=UPI0025F7B01A|nr:cache domain-containing protein [Sulfurimonas sp.]MCK9473252.1 hypothetical protein [Sulfurimonas sp.]MDD3505425.1 cache domain-containing protein [Sulfurimonas sp.]
MLKKIVPIFLIIIAILLYLLFSIRYVIDNQKINYVLDKFVLTLEAQIKNEKMDALKMAISLSKNSALVDALENDDEDLGYKVLSDITNEIKEETNINIRVQILTNDYHIFARSWDDVYTGMPLEDYRSDLEYFEFNKTPRSSIETGRLLSIKTTVPVFKNNKLLGFIEIISFFDAITDFFKNMGIDFYVLMDDKYYNIAVFMQENETINKYIIANRNYNYNNIELLRSINFKNLKADRMLQVDDDYIFYENMFNGSGESIGMFAFVLTQKYLNYFIEDQDEASFLISLVKSSLYDAAKDTSYDNKSKDFLNLKSLLELKEEVPKEQREEYVHKAYQKLEEYSKEELIQLMLEQKIVKKVDGKIK